jgi:hypothetical protein
MIMAGNILKFRTESRKDKKGGVTLYAVDHNFHTCSARENIADYEVQLIKGVVEDWIQFHLCSVCLKHFNAKDRVI